MRAQPDVTEATYCCESNLDEPMMGTADRVDVWLLLEYRPAWKAKAVEEANLGPDVRRWLDGTIEALAIRGLKARPQLVRQPGIDSDRVRLLVGVPGALAAFSGRGYDFLRSVDVTSVVDDPTASPRLDGPRYFVCTNGQRDVCCARFGLPVYAALRQRVGDRVWQTTHLGGHRFAPNVLALPQGVVYGRVTAEAVDPFLAEVEAGRLAFAHLRGRACYPPAVQAAEALAHESGLSFVGMEGGDAAAAVRFAGASGERTVRVRRAAEPLMVHKSCNDGEAQPVTPYQAG